MSVTMSVGVKGFKEVQEQLKKFPQEAPRVFGQAAQDGAAILRDTAKALPDIPVDTGRMRASLGSRKIAQMAAGAFVGVKYGLWIHQGTKYMKARPFMQWALDRGAARKINEIFAKAVASLPKL